MSARELEKQTYVSLETFKKDGNGVKTPVWAAGLDGKLVVVTDGTSYKVKRLKNNPKIRIAACDSRGKKILGPWYVGSGRVIEDSEKRAAAEKVLKKKYGLQYLVLNFFSKVSGRFGRRAYLELQVDGLEGPN